MLHAVLHGKLDEATSEPHRREDALTSTVFGILALVGATDLLTRWLAQAEDRHGQVPGFSPASIPFDIWFWPRLARAEPDVLLRLGDSLCLIEAKLASSRHDLVIPEGAEPDDHVVRDQLRREWQALGPDHANNIAYAPSIRAAICDCQSCLFYVVNRRALKKARLELRDSAAGLPADADLRLVTWQQLYLLLAREFVSNPPRWVSDLRLYLELVEMDAFTGFAGLTPAPEQFRRLVGWRSTPFERAHPDMGAALAGAVASQGALEATRRGWRALGRSGGSHQGVRRAAGQAVRALEPLKQSHHWRVPPNRAGVSGPGVCGKAKTSFA